MLNVDAQTVPTMHRQTEMQSERGDALGQIAPGPMRDAGGGSMKIPRHVRTRRPFPRLSFASAQPWPTFTPAMRSAKRPQRIRPIRSVRMIADLCSSDALHHKQLPSCARLRW